MPPRGGSPIRSIKIAQLLKDTVHAVNITAGSRGICQLSKMASQKHSLSFIFSLYFSKCFSFLQMYGLYDKEGILRFVDSDKDACIAYAELFELGSTNYCLMDLANDTKKVNITNLDQSLGVYNN